MSNTETQRCDRCGHNKLEKSIEVVEIDDSHELCAGCRDDIEYDVEAYKWGDRYTKAHHEKAVAELEQHPKIRCVHESYKLGEITVHTPYVNSMVIEDIRDHFSFRIVSFGPQWQNENIIEDGWQCIAEDGDAFEVTLEYNQHSPPPLPLEADVRYIDEEFLDEGDKQFD